MTTFAKVPQFSLAQLAAELLALEEKYCGLFAEDEDCGLRAEDTSINFTYDVTRLHLLLREHCEEEWLKLRAAAKESEGGLGVLANAPELPPAVEEGEGQ